MSISINQAPSDIQPAQSPIVFSVYESITSYVTSSEFQYTADLYVWDGTLNDSSSYIYQARKYPNQANYGIFDFSRMINSTLTDLSATNGSNIKYYKAVFGWQYASGSTYVTSSIVESSVYKAYDGYAVFPDAINDSLYSQSLYYPIMTDAGVVTQSVTLTDKSSVGSYLKGLSLWVGQSNQSLPAKVICSASYANGTVSSSIAYLTVTGSTNTTLQVQHLPSSPGDSTWSTYWPTTTNLTSYKFLVYNPSNTLMTTINYVVDCAYYYEPVRIAYKNRYGQFDFINFYKRHNNTFNTEQRLYQPQLGTWNSSTLTYNQYQTKQQRYIVDATEVLEANTNWLSDGYNELMKQMMVSDEIYWLYDQTNDLVKPLTIQTNSLQFKTGVNNKLIQYTITFDIGQPYKLLL